MDVKNILIGVVVVAVLGAGAFFLLLGGSTQSDLDQTAQEFVTPTPTPAPVSLGAELGAQTENPGALVPDTNPFEETTTNPFEQGETNPFKDVYKNPFN
jgi:hypothetical protein